MKREKQYDMFDVATGACTLDDYLLQRYSENDLSSTFWIDGKDEVDELRAPKPTPDGRPGTEPEVIPVQGPRAPKPRAAGPPPPPEGLPPEKSPGSGASPPSDPSRSGERPERHGGAPAVPSLESFKSSAPGSPPSLETFEQREPEQTAPPAAVAPPSMEDLLARFHQARREYEERSQRSGQSDEAADQSEDSGG